MKKYINTVTGAVLHTECEVTGGSWREEAPEPPATLPAEQAQKPKQRRKK